MSAESNKARKRRYFDAFNARDLSVFGELFAPGYVLHAAGMPDVCGPKALRQLVSGSFESMPDVHLTIDDMLAEADKVVTRWTLTATHTGDLFGVPATNRPFSVSGIIIDRFADDGRIVEAWEVFDALGLMRQIGAFAQAAQ